MQILKMMAVVLAAAALAGCDKKPDVAPTRPPTPAPVEQVKPAPTASESLKTEDALSKPLTPPGAVTPSYTNEPAKVAPKAGESKKYVIKKGDTFIKIARESLGNEHRVKDIEALNKGVDPSKLHEGQEILIPAK